MVLDKGGGNWAKANVTPQQKEKLREKVLDRTMPPDTFLKSAKKDPLPKELIELILADNPREPSLQMSK